MVLLPALAWMLLGLTASPMSSAALLPELQAEQYFRIQVVDQASGRGVPLVELRLVDGARFFTDSAGVVAFAEPGLMNTEVFFYVTSHGYQYPKDYFGYRGLKLTPTAGGSALIKLQRLNIAERLYRMTGRGIYHHTILLGEDAPLQKPLINGLVAGQDSALAIPYQKKIYWFWGDTSRPAYPLGLFKASGATSLLPGQGGLNAEVGVNFDYWVGKDGFCRNMAPIEGPGVVWLDGLQTVSGISPPRDGVRMFAHYTRLRDLGEPLEQGLALWNDDKQVFERASSLALDNPMHAHGAAPFKFVDGGVEYFYFGNPYPHMRVQTRLEYLSQPEKFEGFTPLVSGSRFEGTKTALQRDEDGNLVWGWRANTPPLTPDQQRKLVEAGLMKRSDSPFRVADVDTGREIMEHHGSVTWNEYRQKFIMIFGDTFAEESLLGEIYLAEADRPEGPWVTAKKIISHDHYSFYNVVQRSFLAEDGGRVIYLEGTYTKMFSSTQTATPRYDYNQIMYRLDLSDSRLRE